MALFEYRHAHEKLHNAVWHLATGLKDLRTRLVDAFLTFDRLEPDAFPDELREEFRKIYRALTGKESGGTESSVRATIAQMNDNELQTIARKILELSGRLDDACEEFERGDE